MKSKVWLIVIVCLLLAGGGIYLITSKNKTKETVSPVRQEPVSPEPTTAPKLLTWNDPAGLTFQYDSGLTIDNNPEDEINYANLEITEPGQEGKILIMASDTKFKNISEWAPKGTDVTLGGKPAKKTATAIGAIDEKILFTIEMTVEDNLIWQDRFDQIISSFEFVYPTAAVQKPSGSSGDIIEEEEIIE